MTEVIANKAQNELVAFKIGEQDFCMDIMSVREIRGWTPATPLPRSPDYMKGVINLRGAVLPIIDFAARMGLPSTEPDERNVIMVAHIGDRLVGLLVDAVSDIIDLKDVAVQTTPDVGSDDVKGFIKGIFSHEGRMVSLIEPDRILPQRELEAA